MGADSVAGEGHRRRRPRFGVTTALPRPGARALDFAREVEAAGFDVLTFADHLTPAVPPFAGATAAAAATEHLHVGTLVLNNDFRHPVDTARESAGVAIASDGRFELGLGAGHMKSEYDAAGLDFAGGAVRVNRLEEAAEIIRGLLDGGPVDVDGAHYRVHAAGGALLPVPSQRVPLLIGGNGDRVLRLAGRLADIAGFAGITHSRDATEVRLTHFGPDGLRDRIEVVRDAAGDRFDDIELHALIQAVVVSDDRHAAAEQLAAELGGVDAADLLDSPFVLVGTHAEMAETLAHRQHRFGVSYWTVFDEWAGRPSAVPDMAEVIALLRH